MAGLGLSHQQPDEAGTGCQLHPQGLRTWQDFQGSQLELLSQKHGSKALCWRQEWMDPVGFWQEDTPAARKAGMCLRSWEGKGTVDGKDMEWV